MLNLRITFGKAIQISSCFMIILLAVKIHNVTSYFFDRENFYEFKLIQSAEAEDVLKSDTKKEKTNNRDCAKEKCVFENKDVTVEKAEKKLEDELISNKINLETKVEKENYEKTAILTANKDLEKKIKELNDKILYLKQVEKNKNDIKQKDIEKLTKIYEQMPPKEAATIFNIMDLHVLINISNHMNPRKISAIMGSMAPERANLLSQYMAGTRTFHNNKKGVFNTTNGFLSLSRNPNLQ